MGSKDDMVYLLSMTYADKTGHSEIWLDDDDSVIAPTSNMGQAKVFESEEAAHDFRYKAAISHMQITPIKAARYFKAKLAGRTL